MRVVYMSAPGIEEVSVTAGFPGSQLCLALVLSVQLCLNPNNVFSYPIVMEIEIKQTGRAALNVCPHVLVCFCTFLSFLYIVQNSTYFPHACNLISGKMHCSTTNKAITNSSMQFFFFRIMESPSLNLNTTEVGENSMHNRNRKT